VVVAVYTLQTRREQAGQVAVVLVQIVVLVVTEPQTQVVAVEVLLEQIHKVLAATAAQA
jgi:hypothetical protein